MILLRKNNNIKKFLNSLYICAVTDDIINAYTRTNSRLIPMSRVTIVPIDINDLSKYTERNNLLIIIDENSSD